MIRYRYNEIKEISIEIFDLYIRNLELTKFNYFYFWSRYDVPLIFFDELNQRIGSSTLKRLNVKTICAWFNISDGSKPVSPLENLRKMPISNDSN